MAWGTKTSATQLTSITSQQFFDAVVTLNPRELAHCEVEANPPATPVDDLIVAVYATLDDATENWDDTPLLEFTISRTLDPNKVAFTVVGIYKFRVGVRRSGTTDTYTSADFSYRKDGVSA